MSGLISVVIPVYNVEKYLEECIESVLKQGYQEFEIILVNDGSSDMSAEICEAYVKADRRIKLIHQKNAGASAARNTGMRLAVGEYLYFLDSDDWLEADAFEKMVMHINASHADFIFFDAYAVDETKNLKSEKFYSHKHKYGTGSGAVLMDELLRNKEFHVTPWHMFFRRDFLERLKLYFEEGIIYEDMIFAYQVFSRAQRVSYLPAFLYSRRFRKESVMTSAVNMKNFRSAVEVYHCVKAYSEQLDENTASKQYIVRCAYNVMTVYGHLDKKDKKDAREKYLQTKHDIISNNAFDDTALRLYCYSRFIWMAYKGCTKLREKIFGKEERFA